VERAEVFAGEKPALAPRVLALVGGGGGDHVPEWGDVVPLTTGPRPAYVSGGRRK